MRVEDDGVGLPPNFNLENNTSLGLELVQKLCKNLKADIEINSKNGTQVKILFQGS